MAREFESFDKERLQEVAQSIVNINSVVIHGKVDDKAPKVFRYAPSKYLPNGSNDIPFFKVTLEVESPVKKGKNQMPYVSHLPIVSWGKLAEDASIRLQKEGIFVHATGRLQTRNSQFPRQIKDEQLLNLGKALGYDGPADIEDALIKEIFQDLDLNKPILRKVTDVSADMLSEGIMVDQYKNEVRLQGVICRKPDLRKTKATNVPALHFKMMINRPVSNNKTNNLQTKSDIINVLMYGQRAKEIYPHLEQYSPVYVIGSLESNPYKTDFKATQEQLDALAKTLGVTKDHWIIQKVLGALEDFWIVQEVWAHDISWDHLVL